MFFAVLPASFLGFRLAGTVKPGPNAVIITIDTLRGMHDFSGNKLNSDQPTLASLLKKHGYATGAVIGSAVLDSRFGLNQGFDFCYDHFDFNRLRESNLEEVKRSGDVVRDAALSWLGH